MHTAQCFYQYHTVFSVFCFVLFLTVGRPMALNFAWQHCYFPEDLTAWGISTVEDYVSGIAVHKNKVSLTMLAFCFKLRTSFWNKCPHHPTYHALVCISNTALRLTDWVEKLNGNVHPAAYPLLSNQLQIAQGKPPELCLLWTSAPQPQSFCSGDPLLLHCSPC